MNLAELHPIFVHIPLALLPAAVLFRVLHMFMPKAGLRIAAMLLLIGGVGFGVLAKESGEQAEHAAEKISEVEDIPASGTIPQVFGEGSLLETHAGLAETTVIVFGLLLVAEAAMMVGTEPMFARFRGKFSLSQGLHRVLTGVWLLAAIAGIAIVVLTGFYGGKLVYDHGVGVTTTHVQK